MASTDSECKINPDQCMERFDRLEQKMWHGNGDEPLTVRISRLEERASRIDRVEEQTKVGQRAFWISLFAFFTSMIGWIVMIVKDWAR